MCSVGREDDVKLIYIKGQKSLALSGSNQYP